MGRYHPHSQDAIYEALVRMGQTFSLRHLLIDPQGNFGTVDDPPGAMRYTEARLSELALRLLDGIEEDTVDFAPNYSGKRSEPTVLPARFPNLLVNGSQGIAVGMATNIPPHNLGEVIDACIHALHHPDASPEDYLQFVKGPDFPTGGYIVGTAGVRQALLTGRGSVRMRAVADIQEIRKGRTGIVITETPYQVSHDRVMVKIADLVNDKRIAGIADVRNESSDRVGIRLVIELKKDAVPQVVLNQLFKNTQLQETFGVNTVALVDGVPAHPRRGGDDRPLPRPPDGGHRAAHPVPPRQGKGQGAHRRGPRHRGGQHRRGGPDHPVLGGHRRGAQPSPGDVRTERDPGP